MKTYINLRINKEFCSNLEQFKSYFNNAVLQKGTVFKDIIENFHDNTIYKWLSQIGEEELAGKVDLINKKQGNSNVVDELAKLLGRIIESNIMKPPYSKCFSFEGCHYKIDDNETVVFLKFKILNNDVYENYVISLNCCSEDQNKSINPSSYKKGERIEIPFPFNHNEVKQIAGLQISIDGNNICEEKYTGCINNNIENGNKIIAQITNFASDNQFIFLNGCTNYSTKFSLISEKKNELCLVLNGDSFANISFITQDCCSIRYCMHKYLDIYKDGTTSLEDVDSVLEKIRRKLHLNLDLLKIINDECYFISIEKYYDQEGNYEYCLPSRNIYDQDGNEILSLPDGVFVDHMTSYGDVVVYKRTENVFGTGYNAYGIYNLNGECILPCEYYFTQTYSLNPFVWGNPLHLENGLFRLSDRIENFDEICQNRYVQVSPKFQKSAKYFDAKTGSMLNYNPNELWDEKVRIAYGNNNEFDLYVGQCFIRHICIPQIVQLTFGREGRHTQSEYDNPNFDIELIGDNTILLHINRMDTGDYIINLEDRKVVFGGSEYELQKINNDYISVGIEKEKNGKKSRKYGVYTLKGDVILPVEYYNPFLPFFISNGDYRDIGDSGKVEQDIKLKVFKANFESFKARVKSFMELRAKSEKSRAESEELRARSEELRAESEKSRAKSEILRKRSEEFRAKSEILRKISEELRAKFEELRAIFEVEFEVCNAQFGKCIQLAEYNAQFEELRTDFNQSDL